MNFILRNLLIVAASTVTMKALGCDDNYMEKAKNNFPDFKGIIEVKHSIEGRMRFYIPILKNNDQVKVVINSELSKINSIMNIEANTITGSLTINYDPKKIDPQLLLAIIIKLLHLEEEVLKKPIPRLGNEMKMVKDSVDMAIYNKSNGLLDGNSILVLTLLISAAYKYYTGNGVKVGPTTCLMWALSYLN